MPKYIVIKSFAIEVMAASKADAEAVKEQIFLDDTTKGAYSATQPVETITVKRFKSKNGTKADKRQLTLPAVEGDGTANGKVED